LDIAKILSDVSRGPILYHVKSLDQSNIEKALQ
jgi:hypothetical protein